MTDLEKYVQLYADIHHIHVFKQTRFPTCSDPQNHTVFINLNEVAERNMSFSIAHEIGHLINRDNGAVYRASDKNRDVMEENANIFAIKLVLSYYTQINKGFLNTEEFITVAGIPIKYFSLADEVLKRKDRIGIVTFILYPFCLSSKFRT